MTPFPKRDIQIFNRVKPFPQQIELKNQILNQMKPFTQSNFQILN